MRSDERSRLLRFGLLCVPARLAFVVASYYAVKYAGTHRRVLVFFASSVVAIGVGLILMAALRSLGVRDKKGFAGGDVYWNSYVHGAIWVTAGCALFFERKWAWALLLVDLVYGVATTLSHYFS